jgi:hypothetical protein
MHDQDVLRRDVGLDVVDGSKDKSTTGSKSIDIASHVLMDLFWAMLR